MANLGLFLKRERSDLAQLLNLLDRVLVGLECGLELGYVWRMAGGDDSMREGFGESLRLFAKAHPVPEARPWFAGLTELYREGAPLVPYFLAFTEALRGQLRREMEDHERTLPFRLNIVLLVFSLPPVFVLLFGAVFRVLAKEWAV